MKDYLESQQELNEEIKRPNIEDLVPWKVLVVFLIGLVGLNIVATLTSLCLKQMFIPEEIKARAIEFNAWINFVSYLVCLIAILFTIGKKYLAKIFSKIKNLEVYTKGAIMGFIILGVQLVYNLIITTIFGPIGSNENQSQITTMVEQVPWLLFFVTVIFAPILEEFVYRYSLFGFVHKYNRIAAYIVSLVIFGFIHFDFTCFNSGSEAIKLELINIPSYLIAGGILCYTYEKHDSLIASITAHATNNLIGFIQILMLKAIAPSA